MSSRHTRSALAFVSALILMGLAGPAAAQETQDTTKLPAELRAARAGLSAAFEKLDGAAAATHFAEDAAVEFQGQTISGRTAIGGWFMEVFSGLSGLRSGASTFVIADTGITERASYVVVVPDGEQNGASETIWKRQADGSWKVARLIVM